MSKGEKYIEIHGIGFPNKGAELLLHAAVERLPHIADKCRPLVMPAWGDPESPRKILTLGGRLKAGPYGRGFDLSWLGNLMPSRLVSMYGMGRESNSIALLDASGLAYCDQWGPDPLSRAISLYRRYRRRGKPVIFLPQAVGPFSRVEIRRLAATLFQLPTHIFVRDAISKDNVRDVCPGAHVEIVPDITIGMHEKVKPAPADRRGWCIIPNARMLDKAGISRDGYLGFLVEAARVFHGTEEKLTWLNHEGASDLALINEARQRAGGIGDILDKLEALEIKKEIGNFRGVLSSRYHGLVSALSQGVPVIATSWSHKYQELLKIFDSDKNVMVDLNVPSGENLKLIRRFVEIATAAANSSGDEKVQAVKSAVESMWLKVASIIDVKI